MKAIKEDRCCPGNGGGAPTMLLDGGWGAACESLGLQILGVVR